ncbi:MAG: hypothetical protein R3E48_23330 [Burkholderiaceae bacterium]
MRFWSGGRRRGGIGMRRVDGPDQLDIVEATHRSPERLLGDGTVYLERHVPKARHVEIQVFGLGDGHAVHLRYERDCRSRGDPAENRRGARRRASRAR